MCVSVFCSSSSFNLIFNALSFTFCLYRPCVDEAFHRRKYLFKEICWFTYVLYNRYSFLIEWFVVVRMEILQNGKWQPVWKQCISRFDSQMKIFTVNNVYSPIFYVHLLITAHSKYLSCTCTSLFAVVFAIASNIINVRSAESGTVCHATVKAKTNIISFTIYVHCADKSSEHQLMSATWKPYKFTSTKCNQLQFMNKWLHF